MRPPTPKNNRGRCIIRWVYQDRAYSLTWGDWKLIPDQVRLELCGKMIFQDCLADLFDSSLNKYRSWLSGIAPTASTYQNHPRKDLPALLTLLETKVEERFNSADDSLLRLLRKYPQEVNTSERAKEFFKWLKSRNLKSTSLKRYLATLQHLRRDLFGELTVRIEQRPRPRPFTKDEVTRILEAIKVDPLYGHWYDFVLLLFNTGLRPGEAIGLRFQDIDLKEKIIHIYESLAKIRGSSSVERIRKPTKTANYRILPMNQRVFEMLSKQSNIPHQPADLIFRSPKGKIIDQRNLSQRGWKLILEALGIERRPLYCCRSTFASHCAESGLAPHVVAQLLGHSRVSTTFDFYLSTVSRPTLPEL